MNIYCTHNFKRIYDRLIKNNSYKKLQSNLIDFLFGNKTVNSGAILNNSETIPFRKKRIKGSGGFRCYFYIHVEKDNCYL